MNPQEEAAERRLCALCTMVYMVSYIARVNFGAVVIEIVRSTGLSASRLAVALTGSFITYGTGQLLSGWFGDRLQPRKLVYVGLLTTGAMNLLIPLCARPWQMVMLWCVNGFAQAFLWPPLVRLMVSLLSEAAYARGMVVVSWGSSVGTMLVYLLAPLLIHVQGWQSVFLASGACAIATALLWNRHCPQVGTRVTRRERGGGASFMSPMLASVMVAIALQGVLRDGVTTWMPSYIADTFALSSGASILTGVALPLFGIACVQLASMIYRRKPGNPVLCAGGLFGAGALAALVLALTSGRAAAVSVFCMAVLTGCMHGVNLMLISMVPAFYRDTGRVSTISGALNACTYMGSAISAYGVARLTESHGWGATLDAWLAIAVLGAVVCFACIRSWKRTFRTH